MAKYREETPTAEELIIKKRKKPSLNLQKFFPSTTFAKKKAEVAGAEVPSLQQSQGTGRVLPEMQMMPSHVPFNEQKKAVPAQIQGEANAQRNEELGQMGVTTTPTSDGVNNKYTLPGGELNYDLSNNDLAIKDSVGAIDARIKAGVKPTPEQAQRIQAIKEQAGFTRGGTDRTTKATNQAPTNRFKRGNLDVSFDGSVNNAAKNRFLQDPVKPTAQINRFNNRQPVSLPSKQASTPAREINTFGDIMRAKYDMATNKVSEGNRRFNVNAGLESQKVNSQINNQNIRTGVMMNDSLNKQKTMEVGNESRAIVNQLQQQYLQETDPDKKNEIAAQLGVIQGRSRQQKSEPWKIVDINTGETGIDGKPMVKQMMFNPNTQQIEDIPQAQLEPTNKVAERVVGGLYQTPKGPMYWNGKGYVKEKPKG